ncbi:hypothetical protein L6R53_16095 [Myxococcota bacterium]|nr:hypothetical protein [Myxococcota bacterium]
MRTLSTSMLVLLLACDDKGGGDDTAGPTGDGGVDGGTADGGVDGGGGDGGTIPADDCDDRPDELFCDDDGRAVQCDEVGDVASVEECGDLALCQEDLGCVSCAVDLAAGLGPAATAPARVRLDPDDVGADFGWRRYSMRPVSVSVDPGLVGGTVTLELEGEGLALWSADGEPLAGPLALDLAELPVTVLVQGLQEGAAGAVTAAVDGCGAEAARVELEVGAWSGLAGRALGGFPWLERVAAFTFDEQPQVGLDPAEHGDRAGLSATAWVVSRRSAEEWALDPTLVDAGDGPEVVTIGGLDLATDTWTVWASDLAGEAGAIATAYDVVLDLDGDGALSPGDLFQGATEADPAFWALSQLTRPGPYKVTTAQYSGGAWLGQRTYYPTDIAELVAAEGPRPLVMMSHGNGHDYTWYDYLGEHLASWGYVFMAHQNNTGPGIDTCSSTTLTNTDYFLGNLDSIADGALEGMIDGGRIAWLGHSRGGEGVARAYDKLVDGVYTPTSFSLDDIVLISSIAPTVFLGVDDSNPHDRWYHQIDAAGDGDVTGGPDSGVVQYLRIAEAAEGARAVHYVQGAAHNDFNCCGFDDGTGPDLIGRRPAQELAKATYLGLLEWVVQGNPATADLVRRSYESFHDAGIDGDIVVASQFRSDPGGVVLVLDDFQSETDTAVSSAGTAVTATVEDLVEGRLDDDNTSFAWAASDPMNGMTLAEDRDDLSQGAVFGWSGEAAWRVELPAGSEDLRGWTWLSLRAAQGTRHPFTVETAGPLTFSVVLIDALGAESVIRLDDVGLSLTQPYQRTGYGAGAGWANEWNTIRLRLADFASAGRGIDLSQVVAVELRFGGKWGSTQGRIGLDDLVLTQE